MPRDLTYEELMAAVDEHGSQRKAAEALGIPRSTLGDRLRAGVLHEDASDLGFPADNVSQYWVKTKRGSYLVKTPPVTEDALARLKEGLLDVSGRSERIAPPDSAAPDTMALYPLPDVHVGMHSWHEETGFNWDLKIAEECTLDTFSTLLHRTQNADLGFLANLGDFFHLNDATNTTPASKHALDVDSRYEKIIFTGARIMRQLVDMSLAKHKTVRIRNVKGNHDPEAIVALKLGLKMLYENQKDRVIIDDTPKQISYHEFGVNLHGFYHGHKMPKQRAALSLMADMSEALGRTTNWHMIHGHFHHELSEEVGKVRVEGFGTIAAPDEHAASGGFRSRRRLVSIVCDRFEGEVGRSYANV